MMLELFLRIRCPRVIKPGLVKPSSDNVTRNYKAIWDILLSHLNKLQTLTFFFSICKPYRRKNQRTVSSLRGLGFKYRDL